LNAVSEFSAKGQAPSLIELAASVGMRSTWAIRHHLDILERKGFLKPRGHRNPRGIALAEPIERAAA
jgi:SOS-response transcriptional repressor LexA